MNIYVYEYIYFSFASICLLPALGYYINNRNFFTANVDYHDHDHDHDYVYDHVRDNVYLYLGIFKLISILRTQELLEMITGAGCA